MSLSIINNLVNNSFRCGQLTQSSFRISRNMLYGLAGTTAIGGLVLTAYMLKTCRVNGPNEEQLTPRQRFEQALDNGNFDAEQVQAELRELQREPELLTRLFHDRRDDLEEHLIDCLRQLDSDEAKRSITRWLLIEPACLLQALDKTDVDGQKFFGRLLEFAQPSAESLQLLLNLSERAVKQVVISGYLGQEVNEQDVMYHAAAKVADGGPIEPLAVILAAYAEWEGLPDEPEAELTYWTEVLKVWHAVATPSGEGEKELSDSLSAAQCLVLIQNFSTHPALQDTQLDEAYWRQVQTAAWNEASSQLERAFDGEAVSQVELRAINRILQSDPEALANLVTSRWGNCEAELMGRLRDLKPPLAQAVVVRWLLATPVYLVACLEQSTEDDHRFFGGFLANYWPNATEWQSLLGTLNEAAIKQAVISSYVGQGVDERSVVYHIAKQAAAGTTIEPLAALLAEYAYWREAPDSADEKLKYWTEALKLWKAAVTLSDGERHISNFFTVGQSLILIDKLVASDVLQEYEITAYQDQLLETIPVEEYSSFCADGALAKQLGAWLRRQGHHDQVVALASSFGGNAMGELHYEELDGLLQGYFGLKYGQLVRVGGGISSRQPQQYREMKRIGETLKRVTEQLERYSYSGVYEDRSSWYLKVSVAEYAHALKCFVQQLNEQDREWLLEGFFGESVIGGLSQFDCIAKKVANREVLPVVAIALVRGGALSSETLQEVFGEQVSQRDLNEETWTDIFNVVAQIGRGAESEVGPDINAAVCLRALSVLHRPRSWYGGYGATGFNWRVNQDLVNKLITRLGENDLIDIAVCDGGRTGGCTELGEWIRAAERHDCVVQLLNSEGGHDYRAVAGFMEGYLGFRINLEGVPALERFIKAACLKVPEGATTLNDEVVVAVLQKCFSVEEIITISPEEVDAKQVWKAWWVGVKLTLGAHSPVVKATSKEEKEEFRNFCATLGELRGTWEGVERVIPQHENGGAFAAAILFKCVGTGRDSNVFSWQRRQRFNTGFANLIPLLPEGGYSTLVKEVDVYHDNEWDGRPFFVPSIKISSVRRNQPSQDQMVEWFKGFSRSLNQVHLGLECALHLPADTPALERGWNQAILAYMVKHYQNHLREEYVPSAPERLSWDAIGAIRRNSGSEEEVIPYNDYLQKVKEAWSGQLDLKDYQADGTDRNIPWLRAFVIPADWHADLVAKHDVENRDWAKAAEPVVPCDDMAELVDDPWYEPFVLAGCQRDPAKLEGWLEKLAANSQYTDEIKLFAYNLGLFGVMPENKERVESWLSGRPDDDVYAIEMRKGMLVNPWLMACTQIEDPVE